MDSPSSVDVQIDKTVVQVMLPPKWIDFPLSFITGLGTLTGLAISGLPALTLARILTDLGIYPVVVVIGLAFAVGWMWNAVFRRIWPTAMAYARRLTDPLFAQELTLTPHVVWVGPERVEMADVQEVFASGANLRLSSLTREYDVKTQSDAAAVWLANAIEEAQSAVGGHAPSADRSQLESLTEQSTGRAKASQRI
jgi:hypothetical protein